MPDSPSLLAAAFASTDSDVLARLRETWNFTDDVPLAVVGQLSLRESYAGNFYYLVNLEDPSSGRKLVSPLGGQPMNAFVPPSERATVRSALQDADSDAWAMAEVQLSSLEIREQRKDPYALNLVPGSLKLLTEIPAGW